MFIAGIVSGCTSPPPHRLRLYKGNVIVAETTTDASGAFAVNLPAGQYTVTCDGQPCRPSPVNAPHGNVPVRLTCCPKGDCQTSD